MQRGAHVGHEVHVEVARVDLEVEGDFRLFRSTDQHGHRVLVAISGGGVEWIGQLRAGSAHFIHRMSVQYHSPRAERVHCRIQHNRRAVIQ